MADRFVDDREHTRRVTVCRGCPLLLATFVCNPIKGGCGCFVGLKATLTSERCPLGKWEAPVG